MRRKKEAFLFLSVFRKSLLLKLKSAAVLIKGFGPVIIPTEVELDK